MGILYKLEKLNDTEDVLFVLESTTLCTCSFALSSFAGSLASIRAMS